MEVITSPSLAWGIVIIFSLVLAEFIKQFIGPMFRKNQSRTNDLLMKQMCDILESNAKMIRQLVIHSDFLHEWHQKSRPDGSPMAYFDEDRIIGHLTDIETSLTRIERKVNT